MKILLVRVLICCALLILLPSHFLSATSWAGDKEERIQALQEKMAKLQGLLAELEEQKLREQPPEIIPWQPLVNSGQERRAYTQYAYLLAPQMLQEDLGALLEQLYFTAARDKLTQRGTLFVVPTLTQTEPEQLLAADYNRSLAAELLSKVGIPSAVSGGLLIVPDPVSKLVLKEQPALYIDLAGCEPMLRARIFELLLSGQFDEAEGLYSFIGNLIAAASPQTFQLYQQQQVLWLSVAP